MNILYRTIPYSASKIGADQLALSFFRSFETPVGIVRPFNTFGPRQSARAVIPSIIIQLVSGLENVKLGLTTPTRDFTFIDDTVNGFISTLSTNKIIGEVVNLGTNYEISILDLAFLISELMSLNINIINDDERIRPEKVRLIGYCQIIKRQKLFLIGRLISLV